MKIISLDLLNFRNYERLSLEFGAGTNILYGNNAQGKTNLLEAVYMSGTSHSQRLSKDRDMIRFGCDEAHIKTFAENKNRRNRIDIHLRKIKSKGIAVNQLPVKRASDLFGIINLVSFSPDDLNIIKNGPSERRRFIDQELCQIDKIYLNDLKDYNKALDQRNKLLKDIRNNRSLISTLDVWDEILVKSGINIIKRRRQFISDLSLIVKSIHDGLTMGSEEIEIRYEPSAYDEKFADILFMSRDRDLEIMQTTTGPHRDDISVMVNNTDMRKFGSQGQQRTCALSLKLSEIELMKEKTGEYPVLLLDDVFSELDVKRQKNLLSYIEKTQTLITCTGLDESINDRIKADKIFYVENGSVRSVDS
jgi:DNA replication and repair protein RecF